MAKQQVGLTKDGRDGVDYTLHKGFWCWVTVGDKSVYIKHALDGQSKIQVFDLNAEMEDPLETINL